MKKIISLLLVLMLVLAMSTNAFAIGIETATIDQTRTGSLSVYKYDLTGATNAGVWDSSSYVSTGAYDQAVNDALDAHAIKGVVFTYLRVADISTYSRQETAGEHSVDTLYGFDDNTASTALLSVMGLTAENAYYTANNKLYFTSDALNTAMAAVLTANATAVKTAMESYIAANGGTAMAETDEHGHTGASELPLGLYLVVETKVPEDVTSTCNPFLVSLPMSTIDGAEWNYDVTVYPKNATGMPTLDKTVREAKADTGKNSGSVNVTDGYVHAASASDGDTLEYQIISKLPTITSQASRLSTYTFTDTLPAALSYLKDDVTIRFYNGQDYSTCVATWSETDETPKFAVAYSDKDGASVITITMTEAGLAEINTATSVYGADSLNSGYSDCAMRITYAAKLHTDASVIYGDTANTNTVQLQWKRSNTDYYDTLTDDAHVSSYGLDLKKQFSDGQGNAANVKFILYNSTDRYYVQAKLTDGVYFVTGHTDSEASATVFTPATGGHIGIKGLEDDSYIAKETATDSGYTLLRDTIKIVISAKAGGTCDVCHEAKLTASATVNGNAVTMTADNSSVNAVAPFTVMNTKGFTLPKTGSYGTWMFTVGGILVMGVATVFIWQLLKKKSM